MDRLIHRSEGFGLPVAEAILAGYPVVANGWSDYLAFMSGETTFPGAYRLTLDIGSAQA